MFQYIDNLEIWIQALWTYKNRYEHCLLYEQASTTNLITCMKLTPFQSELYLLGAGDHIYYVWSGPCIQKDFIEV